MPRFESNRREAVHLSFGCDQCGATPIVGSRFRSRILYEFDLCQECIVEHDKTEFIETPTPFSRNLSRQDGPPLDTVLAATTPDGAVAALNHNSPYLTTGFFEFYESGAPASYQRLRLALIANEHLLVLHIHMCGDDSHGEGLAEIALGLSENRSIQYLVWNISHSDRLRASKRVKDAMHTMLERNCTIERLFIKRPCLGDQIKLSVDAEEEPFAMSVLEGLRTNTAVTELRLDSFSLLSNHCRDKLLEIVENHNTTLRDVYIRFGEEDYRLKLFLANARENWSTRLYERDASPGTRLALLEEVMNYPEAKDPVFGAYYLIRGWPEVVELCRQPEEVEKPAPPLQLPMKRGRADDEKLVSGPVM